MGCHTGMVVARRDMVVHMDSEWISIGVERESEHLMKLPIFNSKIFISTTGLELGPGLALAYGVLGYQTWQKAAEP